METYIQISLLNDFIFCPASIYFHQLYGKLSDELVHDRPQAEGKAVHETIEERRYSDRKNILQGVEVYSTEYKLCGKIDVFDIDRGLLTERKKHITRIYDGYVFQLYAQYYGLTEMGYAVKQMRFYSSDDNKTYPVKLPHEDEAMEEAFKKTIQDMNNFRLENFTQTNAEKCRYCIYEPMCDRGLI